MLNPLTHDRIRDPLVEAALLQGLADWKNQYGPRIFLSEFLDANRAFKQKPLFTARLTPRQQELLLKLQDPQYRYVVTLTWFCETYGCTRVAGARRLSKWGIPVHETERGVSFFLCDLVKAIDARTMELERYGQAEIRYLARRDQEIRKRRRRSARGG